MRGRSGNDMMRGFEIGSPSTLTVAGMVAGAAFRIDGPTGASGRKSATPGSGSGSPAGARRSGFQPRPEDSPLSDGRRAGTSSTSRAASGGWVPGF
jgi:hypothetical protein